MRISWNQLKADIKDKYEKGELLSIYTMGRQWTPEEILEAVESETAEGIEFMLAEKKLQDELKRLKNQ